MYRSREPRIVWYETALMLAIPYVCALLKMITLRNASTETVLSGRGIFR